MYYPSTMGEALMSAGRWILNMDIEAGQSPALTLGDGSRRCGGEPTSDGGQQSSVDDVVCAGEVAGGGGDKEGDKCCDVIGGAWPSERNVETGYEVSASVVQVGARFVGEEADARGEGGGLDDAR